ncbi:hypothetical protein FB451DRAFT_1185014 [Mycena latifolia]|nr:hypothetical protein FB451DRAFT_1185014 [Mycena latifolia]
MGRQCLPDTHATGTDEVRNAQGSQGSKVVGQGVIGVRHGGAKGRNERRYVVGMECEWNERKEGKIKESSQDIVSVDGSIWEYTEGPTRRRTGDSDEQSAEAGEELAASARGRTMKIRHEDRAALRHPVNTMGGCKYWAPRESLDRGCVHAAKVWNPNRANFSFELMESAKGVGLKTGNSV